MQGNVTSSCMYFLFCRQHTRMQLHVSNFLFPTHRCVSVCCLQAARVLI